MTSKIVPKSVSLLYAVVRLDLDLFIGFLFIFIRIRDGILCAKFLLLSLLHILILATANSIVLANTGVE